MKNFLKLKIKQFKRTLKKITEKLTQEFLRNVEKICDY